MAPHKIPDVEMIPKALAVTKVYDEQLHAQLLATLTSPDRYRTAAERYHASFNASMDKAPENVAACEEDRRVLNREHALLMGMVKAASRVDPSLPEKFGVELATTTFPTSPPLLTKPDRFKMEYSEKSGELTASIAYTKAAKTIEIWGCIGDPNDESNWRLLSASHTCTGIKVTGLTPGTKYWFRARAVRGNETGPWSNYLTMMAI
jgi:hypothetical protein